VLIIKISLLDRSKRWWMHHNQNTGASLPNYTAASIPEDINLDTAMSISNLTTT
jgi:hypothetical protein